MSFLESSVDVIEDTPPTSKPVPNNLRSAYRNTPGAAYLVSDSDSDDVDQIGESDDSNTFSGDRVRRHFAVVQGQRKEGFKAKFVVESDDEAAASEIEQAADAADGLEDSPLLGLVKKSKARLVLSDSEGDDEVNNANEEVGKAESAANSDEEEDTDEENEDHSDEENEDHSDEEEEEDSGDDSGDSDEQGDEDDSDDDEEDEKESDDEISSPVVKADKGKDRTAVPVNKPLTKVKSADENDVIVLSSDDEDVFDKRVYPPKSTTARPIEPQKVPLKTKDLNVEPSRVQVKPPAKLPLSTLPTAESPRDLAMLVAKLEGELRAKERAVSTNQKLLKTTNPMDGGLKLKECIRICEADRDRLRAELEQAREKAIGITTPEKDEPSELERLKEMAATLRRQYSLLRPDRQPEMAANLQKKIADLQRKIAQETAKNPQAAAAGSSWLNQRERLFLEAQSNQANLWAQAPASSNLYGGRMNEVRRFEAVTVTQAALKRIHASLQTMPGEHDREQQPAGLKSAITLFPHQKQALAWLIWRETQDPAGGILADDMGLGKTLTMISLILRKRELDEIHGGDNAQENDSDWIEKHGTNLVKSKATLIVCPASLLSQWENEIKKKLKSETLRAFVYHGTERVKSARSLARYDVVITTYGTLVSELKPVLGKEDSKAKLDEMKSADLEKQDAKNIPFLSICWQRVILDEAHQTRNPRSLTSQAVCKLRASFRWAVTGTPIQNKELDMYSLLRFLRCSPFDEYRTWKVWVDNKSPSGSTRLNTLVKCLLLRRTKEQKCIVSGEEIVKLPKKTVFEHVLHLSDKEREVYQEVFSFSQQAMLQYMHQQEEKGEDNAYMKHVEKTGSAAGFRFDEAAAKAKGHGAFSNTFGDDKNVKTHHLLVLLLRLRQICGHPLLIRSMLDEETRTNAGLDEAGSEIDLVSRMSDMSLAKKSIDPLEEVENSVLHISNPVFQITNQSSKIVTLLQKLDEIFSGKDQDKVVVVSQWTSMLEIVQKHIEKLGLKCCAINGKVAVKERGGIVDSFNRPLVGPRVMLLSLGAGGVGLNLVGANHIFLLDMHWNPQLESQACDRIYRVGQTKPVFVHKFLCEDTVERRILDLQRKKLDMAEGVLTGAKMTNANKLTFEDLKSLFEIK